MTNAGKRGISVHIGIHKMPADNSSDCWIEWFSRQVGDTALVVVVVALLFSGSHSTSEACMTCCGSGGAFTVDCCSVEESGPSECSVTVSATGDISCDTWGYCEYIKVVAPAAPKLTPSIA